VNQLWANVQRLAHILAVLTQHSLSYALGERLDQWPRLARYLPPGNLAGPERLRMVFEDAGGTFIKLGQMLALQPDILPLEYCNALFKLLDRINPFEFEETEKVFAEQFGKHPMDIFDHFDPNPIATASIGQVYIAYLGQRKLAVKVQRPSVQSDFAGDIRLMVAAIRLIRVFHVRRLYWMLEPLNEFVSWTREELDFRFEARYMEQLYENARDNAREYIPEIMQEYTTGRVLTLEFLEGITLMNYIRALETHDELLIRRLHAENFDPDQFARNIVDNFLHDAFQYGMFHADLHPANLMILRNNVVGYIDFGITGVISPYLRHHLVGLTLAYSCGDLDAMYNAFFKVSALTKDSDIEGFRSGLRTLADDWYTMQGRERRILKNITLVMLDLLKLSRQTEVWPERDVIKYIRSAIAIDGLITRFAPTFDVGHYLEMVCNQYLTWHARQQLLAFDTLVDWSSASGHILRDGALRAAMVLERVAAGEFPPQAELGRPSEVHDHTGRQAVYLAAIAFAVSLLMVSTGTQVQLGINLYTAEALLIIAASSSLFIKLWRLL
jgi:ubiquinone biosynthesis protein